MSDGTTKDHSCEGYILGAEPNEHGDLVVYRTHANMLAAQANMLAAQTMASYAAGHWLSHEMVWGDDPALRRQ